MQEGALGNDPWILLSWETGKLQDVSQAARTMLFEAWLRHDETARLLVAIKL